jgi:hypothetical protein
VDAPVVISSSLATTEAKATLLRIGSMETRHPRMGAAQQPKVADREPVENKRLMEKLG